MPLRPEQNRTNHEFADRQIAIYRQEESVCCVLMERNKPIERLTHHPDTPFHRLDIVLGVVSRVVPALKGVFIAIGDDHDAFLPIREASLPVKAGQRLIVQIRRITPSNKGHMVTTSIQIPGPFAVFFADERHRKRSKLRAFDKETQMTTFDKDLARLQTKWEQILLSTDQGPAPRLLFACGDPLYRALVDWIDYRITRIQTDDRLLYAQLETWLKDQMPEKLPLLHLTVVSDGFGLADLLGLSDLDQIIKQKKMWLPGGGYIVIEPTEALTVVDVNSGRDIKGRCDHQLRLRTNQEAALEIARQLRLRNTSGMVLIDFLRCQNADDQKLLGDQFKLALKDDRARTRVFGFTAMGLFELIRTAI